MGINVTPRIFTGDETIDLETGAATDRDASPETLTRLRRLCEKTGEPFDGNLRELQALRRIAALEEIHDLG